VGGQGVGLVGGKVAGFEWEREKESRDGGGKKRGSGREGVEEVG